MNEDALQQNDQHSSEDPGWFRPPSRREHWIAGSLFIGFGIFFIALFWLHKNWWFRWVILGLGVISLWHGIRHIIGAARARA